MEPAESVRATAPSTVLEQWIDPDVEISVANVESSTGPRREISPVQLISPPEMESGELVLRDVKGIVWPTAPFNEIALPASVRSSAPSNVPLNAIEEGVSTLVLVVDISAGPLNEIAPAAWMLPPAIVVIVDEVAVREEGAEEAPTGPEKVSSSSEKVRSYAPSSVLLNEMVPVVVIEIGPEVRMTGA